MSIDKNSIQEVLAKADIVVEIGARMELKKAGANFIGLCPFHGEKTPSFSVSAQKQFYHCFGCGKNGDLIQFIIEHDGAGFYEVVADLAVKYGIKLAETNGASKKDEKEIAQSAAAEQACAFAADFYRKKLASAQYVNVQKYINKRGIHPDTQVTFGIGYAPDGNSLFDAIVENRQDLSAFELAGLVLPHVSDLDQNGHARCQDRFRGRLMFPIKDTRGRCIGFGGRVLDDERQPKYLNSPETPIFHKSGVLYGLHEARAHIAREKSVFVTEGYMDVVMMAQHGIHNTVAAMGTALTEDHARLLLRFANNICFVFDGDKAGKAAAWKSLHTVLPLLAAQHSYKFLTLPDGMDPDEFLREHGKAQFLQLAQDAPQLSQYLLDILVHKHSQNGVFSTAESKTMFIVELSALCNLIPSQNPLKEFVLQEADLLVGNPPRLIDAGVTLANGIRGGLGGESAPIKTKSLFAFPQREWLPYEEWKKLTSHSTANHDSTSAVPSVASISIWESLTEAVHINPATAELVASEIIPLLDADALMEKSLIQALSLVHELPLDTNEYNATQKQMASDLLHSAKSVIAKQRKEDVRAELKRLRSEGVLSEEEFVRQSIRIG